MKYLIALVLLGASLAHASGVTGRDITAIPVVVWMSGPAGQAGATVTVATGVTGKTLSLKSYTILNGGGGSCSCYDASAPATTIIPFTNMASYATIFNNHDFSPGAIAVSAAGNSIKCTFASGAAYAIMEFWNK